MNSINTSFPAATAAIDLSGVQQTIGGYRSLFGGAVDDAPDTTTDEYAAAQARVNSAKAIEYLLPRIQKCGARTVLDVGCGVGAMVRTFLDLKYDAFGVDLPGLHPHWTQMGLPKERMFIVDPSTLRLPFADGGIDFVYTLGVIEHVGTSDGHADRLSNHHALRRQWLRELFRVVKPGGAMLIGGPNRRFPVDIAHGLDSRASKFERWLSGRLRMSVHRVWGDNFLWAYEDFPHYLDGLAYDMEPQSLNGFLSFSRVPKLGRSLVQAYVNSLPGPLRGTGFNPWVMALVRKPLAV